MDRAAVSERELERREKLSQEACVTRTKEHCMSETWTEFAERRIASIRAYEDHLRVELYEGLVRALAEDLDRHDRAHESLRQASEWDSQSKANGRSSESHS
jgi:hypothetical protein